jgi:hypothetical protein
MFQSKMFLHLLAPVPEFMLHYPVCCNSRFAVNTIKSTFYESCINVLNFLQTYSNHMGYFMPDVSNLENWKSFDMLDNKGNLTEQFMLTTNTIIKISSSTLIWARMQYRNRKQHLFISSAWRQSLTLLKLLDACNCISFKI